MEDDSSNSENNGISYKQIRMNAFLLHIVTLGDILYKGMMYHEEKQIGYWKTTCSIVKNLEAFKQVWI